MKYIYISKEINEYQLPKTLNEFGEDGFELCTVSLIPRMKNRPTPAGMQQVMELSYLLIFKKCQE